MACVYYSDLACFKLIEAACSHVLAMEVNHEFLSEPCSMLWKQTPGMREDGSDGSLESCFSFELGRAVGIEPGASTTDARKQLRRFSLHGE